MKMWKIAQNGNRSSLRTGNKLEEHNAWVRVLILHCINDDIIPIFEDYKIAKEIMNTFEGKYGLTSDIYI